MSEQARTQPMRTIDVRGEVMAQIALANDETQRNFLILILGLLDQQVEQFNTISKKIDSLLSDEKAIRATVLNGHADTHHEDHDYVKELRAYKKERKTIDQWALSQIAEASEKEVVCDWAKAQMQQALRESERNQTRWDRFVEGVISQAGTIVVSAIAAVLGLAYLVK